MRTILTGVCALALSCAGISVAQDKSTAAQASKDTQQTTKTTTGSKTMKTTAEVVRGKVEKYEPGKSFELARSVLPVLLRVIADFVLCRR